MATRKKRERDPFEERLLAEPEIRLELVDGRFLVGGREDGSRWLLREIVRGWGAEAALAFGSLDRWRQALGEVYGSRRGAGGRGRAAATVPRLGTAAWGPHRGAREVLMMDLFGEVREGVGLSYGRDVVVRLGEDAFTPDLFFAWADQAGRMHPWFFDGPPDLIVEVLLPEHADLDRELRRAKYESAGVPEYWIVDPVKQQVEFLRGVDGTYVPGRVDPDGRYRGIEGLDFLPARLWELERPCQEPGPFEVARRLRRRKKVKHGSSELQWGYLPFEPRVELDPLRLSFEEFISWAPRAKLEGYGGHWPIVDGTRGTQHVLGLLLSSLGIREAVRLVGPGAWRRGLAAAERRIAVDERTREEWWAEARRCAALLVERHGVGGVGLAGDLLRPRPLDCWSYIVLLVWDAPEGFRSFEAYQDLKSEAVHDLVEVDKRLGRYHAREVAQMAVLAGQRPSLDAGQDEGES